MCVHMKLGSNFNIYVIVGYLRVTHSQFLKFIYYFSFVRQIAREKEKKIEQVIVNNAVRKMLSHGSFFSCAL